MVSTDESVQPGVSRVGCDSFSVVYLAREGLFALGLNAGFVELLDGRGHEIVHWLPVRTEIGYRAGLLRVFYPYEAEFRLETVPVRIRLGFHWLIMCPGLRGQAPCSRLVRRLYRPIDDQDRYLFSSFACRFCWQIRFPRYPARAGALGLVAELDANIREAQRLRGLILESAVFDTRVREATP
jgi:hypothetical protein